MLQFRSIGLSVLGGDHSFNFGNKSLVDTSAQRSTHKGLPREDALIYPLIAMEYFTDIFCKVNVLCNAGEPNFLGSLALGAVCLVASGIILATWVRVFDR